MARRGPPAGCSRGSTHILGIPAGAFGHTCLVHFDKTGVGITAIHEPVMQGDGPLTIEEVTQAPTVTLALGKRKR